MLSKEKRRRQTVTATKPVSVTLNGKLKTVTVKVTKPVSVTLNGHVKNYPPYSPLTKGGHRGVRTDETGLVTVAVYCFMFFVFCSMLFALCLLLCLCSQGLP